jgi:hypothetical protein
MTYKELEVSSDIPASKLKRAFDNGTLSLTSSELRGRGATLHLHPESYAKALKAKNSHKGTRLAITHKEIGHPFKHLNGGGIHGGSIFGKIWSGIKSAFKWAKDSGVLSKVADAAIAPLSAYTGQPQLVAAARGGLKQLTGIGIGIEDPVHPGAAAAGGKITFGDVKSGAKRALSYAKRKGILTDIVDEGERFLLTKATAPSHTDLIKTVRGEVRRRYGVGVAQPKKMVKGSAEAKSKMAHLRSMRKGKTAGGSFRM